MAKEQFAWLVSWFSVDASAVHHLVLASSSHEAASTSAAQLPKDFRESNQSCRKIGKPVTASVIEIPGAFVMKI